MRHFHKTNNKYHCPTLNLDKLWSLVSEQTRKNYADKKDGPVPVIDAVQAVSQFHFVFESLKCLDLSRNNHWCHDIWQCKQLLGSCLPLILRLIFRMFKELSIKYIRKWGYGVYPKFVQLRAGGGVSHPMCTTYALTSLFIFLLVFYLMVPCFICTINLTLNQVRCVCQKRLFFFQQDQSSSP